jgi:hypothetical protein
MCTRLCVPYGVFVDSLRVSNQLKFLIWCGSHIIEYHVRSILIPERYERV